METEPLAVITTIGVFGVVVKAVVDGVRRRFPGLDGLLVQGLALVFGFGLAWAFQLHGAAALIDYIGADAATVPNVWVDYVVTGAAIAAGAGFLAEIAGRTKPQPVVVEVDENGAPL